MGASVWEVSPASNCGVLANISAPFGTSLGAVRNNVASENRLETSNDSLLLPTSLRFGHRLAIQKNVGTGLDQTGLSKSPALGE